MEPPLTLDDGSTASTATRWPRSIRNRPRASMKVLLPTPGTPLMPRRNERPVCGSRAFSSSSACSRWSGRVDSSSVMVLASARRWAGPAPAPARRACAHSGGVMPRRPKCLDGKAYGSPRTHWSQFSSCSPSMRSNSRVLLVTRMASSAKAWAAISRSIWPIGRPCVRSWWQCLA